MTLRTQDSPDTANGHRRDAVRQRVSTELRAALIAGQLEPGRVYSAPAIAAHFEVSATPVREAMLDLARDGMVEVVPNTGFRITEVTPAELDQLAEVRHLLEVPTMRQIATNLSPEDEERIDALRPLVQSMITAEQENDLVAYMAADTQFHTSFLALHGNQMIVSFVRHARERSRLHGLLPLAHAGRLAAATKEHLEMIEAALSRDGARMEAVVQKHIGHVRNEWAPSTD